MITCPFLRHHIDKTGSGKCRTGQESALQVTEKEGVRDCLLSLLWNGVSSVLSSVQIAGI